MAVAKASPNLYVINTKSQVATCGLFTKERNG